MGRVEWELIVASGKRIDEKKKKKSLSEAQVRPRTVRLNLAKVMQSFLFYKDIFSILLSTRLVINYLFSPRLPTGG